MRERNGQGQGRAMDEDQLRLRLQEAMVSAGVGQGRVALEVLYWLPKEFMEDYQRLYMRALHLGDGDDQEKAGADEGRIKAKVRGELRGTKKGLGAGVGGGKKYKREWVVKDEQALEIKARVDRVLRGLVQKETRKVGNRGSTPGGGERAGVGERAGESPGRRGGGKLMEVPQGVGDRRLVAMGDKKRCEGCGKIASSDWVTCPFPHS